MGAPLSGLLERIVAEKRRAHAARLPRSLDDLLGAVERANRENPVRGFARALRSPTTSPSPSPLTTTSPLTLTSLSSPLTVIAEFKRCSPSAGELRAAGEDDPATIARDYAAAGAGALSILTDGPFFGAREGDLVAARSAVPLPVLRKDFLLDARDVLEARIAGADCALLIVRLLDAALLAELIRVGQSAGLDLLVEAHNDAEVELARDAGATLIGVNHRDLDTLRMDLSLSARARTLVGPDATLVAESGIKTPADMQLMRSHGADAVLVGESLLRQPSPGVALRALRGVAA